MYRSGAGVPRFFCGTRGWCGMRCCVCMMFLGFCTKMEGCRWQRGSSSAKRFTRRFTPKSFVRHVEPHSLHNSTILIVATFGTQGLGHLYEVPKGANWLESSASVACSLGLLLIVAKCLTRLMVGPGSGEESGLRTTWFWAAIV